MINPQWPVLSMSRINFHGPKDVRCIEVLLYFFFFFFKIRVFNYNTFIILFTPAILGNVSAAFVSPEKNNQPPHPMTLCIKLQNPLAVL